MPALSLTRKEREEIVAYLRKGRAPENLIAKVTPQKPMFKDGRRRTIGYGAVRQIQRWLAVKRALKENPAWLLDAAFDQVAADHGVNKSTIRRSYNKFQRGLDREGGSTTEQVFALLDGCPTLPATPEERATQEAAAKRRP